MFSFSKSKEEMASMAPMPPSGGSSNNFIPGFKQLWHPPFSVSTIGTIILIFLGSFPKDNPKLFKTLFMAPIGFFTGVLIAVLLILNDQMMLAFALLFWLLSLWAHTIVSKAHSYSEGFLSTPAGLMDWVTNSNTWYVERVLKEKPLGIQDKSVVTFPVGDD